MADVNVFGAAVSSVPGSPFAPSASSLHSIYKFGSKKQTGVEARAILAAVLVAVAMLAYPDEQAMDGLGDATRSIGAREVRERVEAMASSARDAHAEATGETPDEEERGGRVWDAVWRNRVTYTTPRGRLGEGTLAWHVVKAFEILDAHGHVQLSRGGAAGEEDETGISILPRDRLRKLVRHHAASGMNASILRAMADCAPGGEAAPVEGAVETEDNEPEAPAPAIAPRRRGRPPKVRDATAA